jgi:hypothetical protein
MHQALFRLLSTYSASLIPFRISVAYGLGTPAWRTNAPRLIPRSARALSIAKRWIRTTTSPSGALSRASRSRPANSVSISVSSPSALDAGSASAPRSISDFAGLAARKSAMALLARSETLSPCCLARLRTPTYATSSNRIEIIRWRFTPQRRLNRGWAPKLACLSYVQASIRDRVGQGWCSGPGLAGVLAREGFDAKGGVFVTLTGFTEQARTEAKQLGLSLLDGIDLYARVEKVRRPEPCPSCGAPMMLDRSPRGWWFRCVNLGCTGKRDLGRDPAQAVELLTQPPT